MSIGDAKKIESRFKGRGIMHGQELLVDWRTAIELIEACRGLGVGILGLDFYRKSDIGLNEIDGGGADFSEFFRFPNPNQVSIAAAFRLLSDGLPDKADYASFVLKE